MVFFPYCFRKFFDRMVLSVAKNETFQIVLVATSQFGQPFS